VLNFYRRLIALRKAEPVLVYGEYDLVLEEDQKIYAYTRSLDEKKLMILCNLTKESVQYGYENDALNEKNLLLSNYSNGIESSFLLQPFETRVYRLDRV
jgi:alpha-glucosidase